MAHLPTGTVTFLFTDIEGSTALLAFLGDARYADVHAEHGRVLTEVFAGAHGQVIGTRGDAFLVAFARARDAVRAAVGGQRALLSHAWPEIRALAVRMGLHTGEPVNEVDGYIGLDVHRAARICAAGHGRQVLLSEAVAVLAAPDLPPDVSLKDLGAHRLKDLEEAERLMQIVHPDLPVDFPALRSLDAHPNNLPRQLTSFIGRQREIEEITRLLGTAPLTTLTGSGGAGKTRLALQVARDVLERYADGVWIVQLASLSESGLVPKAVASALSLPEQRGRPLLDTVVDYLRQRSALLVLDNCEHLLQACARLVEVVLQACPHVQVLATSRQALGIAGELKYRVPSLSLPDLLALPEPADLTRYEAVRLFVERATLSRPGFQVTNSNAPVVAQVAHRLDGIPLAIELAAARLKVLTVEQIASRLDDRFRFLTGAGWNTVPRHQTLRAVMDWSYALLSPEEQRVLRRLGVFAGGCALDAVDAVCVDAGEAEIETLDVLTNLADKSLLEVETQAEEARYWLLEIVRQYSMDKLEQSGDAPAVRRRHQRWILQLVERAEPELRGQEQEAWLKHLEIEHDNIRAALAWSGSDEDDVETPLRIAGALEVFWFINGDWAEGRTWLEETVRRSGRAAPSKSLAKALGAAGRFAFLQGHYEHARVLIEQGLALNDALGDRHGASWNTCTLGNLTLETGDTKRAVALLEKGVDLSRALADKWLMAFAIQQLADSLRVQGDYERAAHFGMEAIALCRDVGDRWRTAVGLRAMGLVSLRQRDYGRATMFYADSLKLCKGMKTRWIYFQCLEGFGCAANAQAQPDRAATLFGAAASLRESLEARRDADYQSEVDHHVRTARASLGDTLFDAAWSRGRSMTMEQAIEYALSLPAGAASPRPSSP